MKTKAIVIKCDKCGATDILRKVTDGPSQTTDVEKENTGGIGRFRIVIRKNYILFYEKIITNF